MAQTLLSVQYVGNTSSILAQTSERSAQSVPPKPKKCFICIIDIIQVSVNVAVIPAKAGIQKDIAVRSTSNIWQKPRVNAGFPPVYPRVGGDGNDRALS
jgi:hypothetical protein